MQVQLSQYTGLSLVLAASVALGACNGGNNNAATTTDTAAGGLAAPGATDTGMNRADTMGNMGQMAPAGSDTTAMNNNAPDLGDLSNLSDANFAALVSEANKADSAAGSIAADKATSPDVKAFAKRMMADHHALEVQTEQLAKQLNLTPQPPANDPVKQLAMQEANALQSTPKGPAFDSTYIDNEVTVHKAVLDLLDAIQDNAENDQLKALAKKAEPVIQNHLDRAQAIQKSLTSST